MEFFNLIRKGDLPAIQEMVMADTTLLQKKDARGFTPLVMATYSGHYDTARFFLENGAAVNQQDGVGNTALMGVCFKGDTKIVQLLIDNGADVNLKNIAGKTPLDGYFYNCNRLDSDVVDLLLDAGAEVTSRGYSTPSLYYGIQNKCWTGLNNFLPKSDVKIGQWYFKKMAEGAISKGHYDHEAAKTLYLTLDHMSDRFDAAKFASEFCAGVSQNQRGVCNDTFNVVLSLDEKRSDVEESIDFSALEATVLNDDFSADLLVAEL